MALPTTGSLSIKGAAGAGRSVSGDVDGNETGNKSLASLSTTAGKTANHSMLEFYGFAWGIPPTPTTIAATDAGGGIANITWSHGLANGNPIHKYRLERESSGNPGVWVFISNPLGTATSASDAAGTGQYIYRLRAENTGGVSAWANSNSVIVA